VGLIYVALRGPSGASHPRTATCSLWLANQAAVAVENAHWTGTLERRVEERTAELAKATQLAEDARAVAEQANRERVRCWTR